MPNEARGVSGWLWSRDRDNGVTSYGDHLGVGGTDGDAGRLVFAHGTGDKDRIVGRSVIPRWQWNHVAFVRDGESVRLYLNGKLEVEGRAAADFPAGLEQFFFGGRSDNSSNWEGRLDEIAVFNRALTPEEVARLAP